MKLSHRDITLYKKSINKKYKYLYAPPYACSKKNLFLPNSSLKKPILRLKMSNLTLKTPTPSLNLSSPEA